MTQRNTEDFDKFFKIYRCFDCKLELIKGKKDKFFKYFDNYGGVMIDMVQTYICPKCNDTYIIQKDGTLKRWNL